VFWAAGSFSTCSVNGGFKVPVFCVRLLPKVVLAPAPNAGVLVDAPVPKPEEPPPKMPPPVEPVVVLPKAGLDCPKRPPEPAAAVLPKPDDDPPPNPPKVLFDVAVPPPKRPPPADVVVVPKPVLFWPNGEDVALLPKPVRGEVSDKLDQG
jgi:hypothetical protein